MILVPDQFFRLFEFAFLIVKFQEHMDFAQQNFGIKRFDQEIHRTGIIPLEHMFYAHIHGGNKDNRQLSGFFF